MNAEDMSIHVDAFGLQSEVGDFRVYMGVTYLFGSPWSPVDWFPGLGASVLCEGGLVMV
jgi:hypothetical protein